MTDEAVESGPQDNADPLDAAINAAIEGSEPEAPEAKEESPPEKLEEPQLKVEEQETPEAEEAEGEDDGEPIEEPVGEATEDATAEAAPEEEEDPESIPAPEHWSVERREAFGKLGREAQETVLNMSKDFEGEFTRKSQELAETRKFAEAIRADLQPYSQELALSGMDEVSAVRQLIALHGFAKRDPMGYLRYAAKGLGVDIDSALTPEDSYVDPQVAALKAQVDQMGGYFQQFQTQQQLSQQQQVNAQIQAFADATDSGGSKLHPYFEKVESAMAGLMKGGLVESGDLERAYQMAVNMDPELAQAKIDAERRAAEEKEAKRRNEAAEKAKKASKHKVSKSSTASTPARKSVKSLDDAVGNAIDQHFGGAV